MRINKKCYRALCLCNSLFHKALSGRQLESPHSTTQGLFVTYRRNTEKRCKALHNAHDATHPWIMFFTKIPTHPTYSISIKYMLLYSIITPFDAFEISCIWKYYGKCSICSFGANASFSIIFSKVFKTLNFSWIFSMLSKNRKRCHDLKIAYRVKG